MSNAYNLPRLFFSLFPKNWFQEANGLRTLAVGAARVLGESLPQLVLQTSVLMAQGRSLAEQPLLLGSTLLSLGTAAKKVAGMTLALGKWVRFGLEIRSRI